MARERRTAEDLSVPELEALLARKRVEARQARLQRLRQSGRAYRLRPDPIPVSRVTDFRTSPDPTFPAPPSPQEERWDRWKAAANKALLVVEIAAVAGLGFMLFRTLEVWRELNQETAQALAEPNAAPTPLLTAVVLPSGHTPPTSPGGARPKDEEIPANLRPLVQSLPSLPIPTPGPEHARNVFIPALWSLPAPVVQGDGWEQLKRGVGQHLGTANPGEVGNMVLSAHNDIYGELFRDLDRLKPGDSIYVYTASREYHYRVTGFVIVEPTEVSVMNPTPKPTVTLISCYPYLVDNKRIVVFGELVEG